MTRPTLQKVLKDCRAAYLGPDPHPNTAAGWRVRVAPAVEAAYKVLTEGRVSVTHRSVAAGDVLAVAHFKAGGAKGELALWPQYRGGTGLREFLSRAVLGEGTVSNEIVRTFTALMADDAGRLLEEAWRLADARSAPSHVRAAADAHRARILEEARASVRHAAKEALRKLPLEEVHRIVDEAAVSEVLAS